MDTGASGRPLSSESRVLISSPRGKKKCCLLGLRRRQEAVKAKPKIQDHTEGDTRGSKGTAAGLKCKTEGGPMPPQSKKK